MADAPVTATPTPEGGAPPEAPKVEPKPEPKPEAIDTTTGAKPDEKPPEKPEPKFYERKINGRVEKIPAEAIDAAAQALGMTPNEILSTSQLKRAAYERFEAAEKARKEVQALRGIKDPWKLAQQLAGLDDAALDAAAEARLLAKLQRESMDPAQRQLLEERESLAREKAALEAEKQAAAEKTLTAQAQAVRNQLEPLVIDAIEKVGLPRTPDAVRATVSELERQHRYGLPLNPLQAATDARDQFFRPSVSMLKNLPADAIIRELGKEKYDELLRHSIAQRGNQAPAPAVEPAKPAQPERPYLTEREWKARYG